MGLVNIGPSGYILWSTSETAAMAIARPPRMISSMKQRRVDRHMSMTNSIMPCTAVKLDERVGQQIVTVGKGGAADLSVNAMRAPSMVPRIALVIWAFARSAKKRGKDAPTVAACSAAKQLAWRVFFASATRS